MNKILISGCEVADNIKGFSDALNSEGRLVDSFCFSRNPYYLNNKYTFNIELPKIVEWNKYLSCFYERTLLFLSLFKVLTKYDVFVFVWKKTFLPLNLDLFLLRALGKKVVVFNCGSDVRYPPIHSKIDTEVFGYKKSFVPPEYQQEGSKILHFLRPFYAQKVEEVSGCLIVSMRNQATFLKKPCHIFRFPVKGLVKEPRQPNKTPLLLHAPSNREVKGTKYVLDAVERLRSEGLNFDFELIEGKSNSYVLSRVEHADIIIDQPGPWLAKFAAEGLSASCIVVGGNEPDYEGLEYDSPVISFLPDGQELSVVLASLIQDRDLRTSLMERSFNYWQREYSPEAFCRFFSALLSGESPQLSPLPNHRAVLLKYAPGIIQRALIRAFY